jgi:hypothetical protein
MDGDTKFIGLIFTVVLFIVIVIIAVSVYKRNKRNSNTLHAPGFRNQNIPLDQKLHRI